MVAIYARQSLEKKNSLSIEGQITLCRKFVKDNEEFKIYYESRSGKNTSERPMFLEMLEDIRKGIILTVIVYRLDRISRNVLDFCTIWEEFKKHNVHFISCNENFDTSTPMGEAMLMIAMVFAQMERATIIERVTDNYFSRAKQGYYLGGYAPYGFKKVDIIFKGKKTAALEANETQSKTLQYMYDQYAETNISLGKLGFKMTAQGYQTNKGYNWSACNIGRVLRNPVYVKADAKVYQYLKSKGATINNDIDEFIGENGCYVYAPQTDSKGIAKKKKSGRKFSDLSQAYVTIAPHKGLVFSDVWLKCQYKLDNNKQVKCDRSGTHSWLSGIMRCANCGYGITVVNNNRGKNYISCYGKKAHACPGREKAWQLYEIEDVVYKKFKEKLKELSEVSVTEIIPKEPVEVDLLRKQSIKLSDRINNLLDELEVAKEEEATNRILTIRKRLDTISEEQTVIDKEITRLLNENNNRKKRLDSNYNILYILDHWDNLNMIEKQNIARTFIQHVVVGDWDVSVVFY